MILRKQTHAHTLTIDFSGFLVRRSPIAIMYRLLGGVFEPISAGSYDCG